MSCHTVSHSLTHSYEWHDMTHSYVWHDMSCHTYEWVMSHSMNDTIIWPLVHVVSHIWMSHVMNVWVSERQEAREWERERDHMTDSACRVKRMNESCHAHTYEWVMSCITSHIWISEWEWEMREKETDRSRKCCACYGTRMNRSCHKSNHTYEWVMSPITSHIWMSHVMSHIWTSHVTRHVTRTNEWGGVRNRGNERERANDR